MLSRREALIRFFAPTVGLVVLAGCGGGSLVSADLPVAETTSDYQLGAGDVVRVTIFGEEELSGEYEIDGTGAFSMPLVGTIEAGGKTVRELEESITSILDRGYLRDPRVSVEVLNYRPFYIVGEVNNPGSYPYRSGMTLIEAVAVAGGFTYRAQESGVVITRDGAEYKAGSLQSRIQPGDVIRVEERFF